MWQNISSPRLSFTETHYGFWVVHLYNQIPINKATVTSVCPVSFPMGQPPDVSLIPRIPECALTEFCKLYLTSLSQERGICNLFPLLPSPSGQKDQSQLVARHVVLQAHLASSRATGVSREARKPALTFRHLFNIPFLCPFTLYHHKL